MKTNAFLNEGVLLVVVGGSILFCAGYFLPDDIALPGATFVAALIGFIIYTRVSSWQIEGGARKVLLAFALAALMSAWASLCLLVAYGNFPRSPVWTDQRRNGFVILDFFFPIFIVFLGWLSNMLSAFYGSQGKRIRH